MMTDDGEGPIMNLPAEPLSPRRARAFVDAVLAAWGLTHLRERAVLLTSEIVTNAVLHARTSMALGVALVDEGRAVRIAVTDGSPVMPRQRACSALASTGRGLAMVRAVARNFGVEPTGDGKTVWFELPAPAGPHAAADGRPS